MQKIVYGLTLILGLFIGVLTVVAFTVIPSLETKADLIISIASAVIAFSALGLTTWQIKQSEKQIKLSEKNNILSVTPALHVHYGYDDEKSRYSISIQNNGIGPAFFNDYCLTLNGVEISNDIYVPELMEQIYKIKNEKYQLASGCGEVSQFKIWAPNEKFDVFIFEIISEDKADKEEVRMLIHEITVALRGKISIFAKYKDLYGNSAGSNGLLFELDFVF